MLPPVPVTVTLYEPVGVERDAETVRITVLLDPGVNVTLLVESELVGPFVTTGDTVDVSDTGPE